MRRSFISAAIALAGVAAIGVPAVAAHASSDPDVLYKSTVSPLPNNLPSQPFQAQQTSEFGNQIVFTKAAQPLSSVIVTMSSWGCQTGSWSAKDCVTTPGATFTEPITLNIYNTPATASAVPGSLITSMTKTFKIPYRPSTSSNCSGPNGNGGWGSGCANGKAANITFNFSKSHVNLPSSIVFGIAYNTSQYGPHPYGALPCESTVQGCPYDSLNVALSQDPTNVTKGSDPNPGKVFWNTSTASAYCDGGAAGSGFFRLDSPGSTPADQCWNVGPVLGAPPYYVPAVEFLEG
jgi:hypothetical protein